MKRGIIAVDIGGSHVTSVMINDLEAGNFVSFQKNKIDHQDDLKSIINGWYNNIAKSIAQAPKVFSNQVAIAIPGPFDYQNGIGLYHKNGKFAALKNKNIKTMLNSFFSEDITFHFENDAACFGIGESYFGETKSYSKNIAITLGTGIGCTFMTNKKVIKSGNNVPIGGEIFHLPFKNATADDYFSTRWFVHRAKEKFGIEISGVRELILQKSNYSIESIFQEFATNLIEFLLPIAQQFGAEAIVFGGNISKAWMYFSTELKTVFTNNGIEILRSKLNEHAICLGAAQSLKTAHNKTIFL